MAVTSEVSSSTLEDRHDEHEDDDKTAIFRAEASVQRQFSKRFSLNIYGKYSNIASATAAGFEFTEIGVKAKWLFLKKPLFYKSLNLD